MTKLEWLGEKNMSYFTFCGLSVSRSLSVCLSLSLCLSLCLAVCLSLPVSVYLSLCVFSFFFSLSYFLFSLSLTHQTTQTPNHSLSRTYTPTLSSVGISLEKTQMPSPTPNFETQLTNNLPTVSLGVDI